MAVEALNLLLNGSGLCMDVFKCISVLLGADGCRLANCFTLRGVCWRESSTLWAAFLSLVIGAE